MSSRYISDKKFNGYDLKHPESKGRYVYVKYYLYRLQQIMEKSLKLHRRVSVFRFDLRLPEKFDKEDSEVITRFFKSLSSKISVDVEKKKEKWNRTLYNKLLYVWAKEKNNSEQYHYHVALLLNGDIYNKFGDYNADKENLSSIIKQAWNSAIKEEHEGLVEFCRSGVYYLNRNSPDIEIQKNRLFERVCYLAKAKTKVYGYGMRNFGASRC